LVCAEEQNLSVFSYVVFGIVGLLLLLFLWAARGSQGRKARPVAGRFPEESRRSHVTYLSQIRQALGKTDAEYLAAVVSKELQHQVARERRRIALAYLSELRGEYRRLVRLAKVIAVLSPEVVAMRELERLRLTIEFTWRFEWIRLTLLAGWAPMTQLAALSDLLSGLSVRLEAAMKELGERAAFAAEISSFPDRRRINPV
jgi:hypothetical protein